MFGHDYKDDLKLGKQTLSIYHKPVDVDVLYVDNSGRMQTCLIKQDVFDETINQWTDEFIQPYAILYYNGNENTFKYLCEPEGIKSIREGLECLIEEDAIVPYFVNEIIIRNWIAELEKCFHENLTDNDIDKMLEEIDELAEEEDW